MSRGAWASEKKLSPNERRARNARRSQKWRQENPEEYRIGMAASRFGISKEEASYWRSQPHCAACGKERHGRMCIDHCHDSGKIRGLVHNKCNIGIAHAEDSPETAWQWSLYLTRHSFDLRDLCVR